MRLEPCGWRALLRAARRTLCPPTATGLLQAGHRTGPENPPGRGVPRAPAAGSKFLRNFPLTFRQIGRKEFSMTQSF